MIKSPSPSGTVSSTRAPSVVHKNSGKIHLLKLVNESYQLACRTRTGTGGIKYISPTPPPVIEKLKNKSFTTGDMQEKPLAFYSLLNGKSEEIELPSFKDCIKGIRIDSQSEMAFNKIEECKEKLGNFEKKINGLEILCKYQQPGSNFTLNNKFLLKLGSNPQNKYNLIKKFNESCLGSQSEIQSQHKRNRSTFSPIKNDNKMTEIPEIFCTFDKSKKKNSFDKDYFKVFRTAKEEANAKTIKILAKLKADRSKNLRNKANLILNENEPFKGKIHSFQTLKKFKKVFEKEKYSNLVKCKKQVELYIQLLDYLKKYKGMPTHAQIAFVESIREFIEGGWTISKDTVEEILSTFCGSEKEELTDLNKMALQYLNEKRKEDYPVV